MVIACNEYPTDCFLFFPRKIIFLKVLIQFSCRLPNRPADQHSSPSKETCHPGKVNVNRIRNTTPSPGKIHHERSPHYSRYVQQIQCFFLKLCQQKITTLFFAKITFTFRLRPGSVLHPYQHKRFSFHYISGKMPKSAERQLLASNTTVSHHEPGGMSVREVLNIFQGLDCTVIGVDIVEYNPSRDIHDMTAMVAAKLVKELGAKMI